MASEHLTVFLGLNKAKFEQGLSGANKAVGKLNGLMGALGAGISVAAIASMAKKTADWADDLLTLGDNLGLTTDFLQRFNYLMDQSGVKTTDGQKALERLTNTYGEALNGSQTAADTFRELGISLTDTGGRAKGTEQLFYEVVQSLSGIETQAEKVRIANDLFGKSGVKAVGAFSGGLDKIKDTMSKVDIATNEEIQSVNTLKDQWEHYGTTVLVYSAKAISGFITTGIFLKNFIKNLGRLTSSIWDVGVAFASAFDPRNWTGEGMTKVWDNIKKGISDAVDVIDDSATQTMVEYNNQWAKVGQSVNVANQGLVNMKSNLKEQIQLLKEQMGLYNSLRDRNAPSLQEMANMPAYTPQGARNRGMARAILGLEERSKFLRGQGMDTEAEQAKMAALALRNSHPALSTSEGAPVDVPKMKDYSDFQKYMEDIKAPQNIRNMLGIGSTQTSGAMAILQKLDDVNTTLKTDVHVKDGTVQVKGG